MDTPDHYAVLGVSRSAKQTEIKAAYHHLAKQAHPDAGGSEAAMERVNNAYRVLSDPGERSRYNDELTRPRLHEAHNPSVATAPSGEIISYLRPMAFHKLRRNQVRVLAWEMLKTSVTFAIPLNLIAIFFGAYPIPLSHRYLLALLGFIPISTAILAIAFILDPSLRLALHDAPRRKARDLKNYLLMLLAIAAPVPILAIGWAFVLRIW